MPVVVNIPDDIAESANRIAKNMGITTEHLLIDALRAHFPPISDALRDEFDALERASDEDLARLELN